MRSQNCIIGTVYFSSSKRDLISSESNVPSVDAVLQFYPKHLFIHYGDYNNSEISRSNDVHGVVYSYPSNLPFPCIPELFALRGIYMDLSISVAFDSAVSINQLYQPADIALY